MGERFGDYELIRKIATGGMAEIYLARHSTPDGFGRPVVVKRMLPQLAVRSDFVTMFLDEARLAANLAHPNVVQVFNLGSHEGAYFMAMELIDGPHLGALFAHSLRARKALPLDFCAFSVARSADGLDYAHDRIDPATGLALNIVHRDISPQNILVSRHGDVKVTDFGVAKAETQEAKTRTGIIKGKVSYMSPEQCLGEQVDRRTDVFALGIVLYELLTRRRLFRDKSDLLVMQRITNEDLAPPSSLNPKIDQELDRITLKALARSREERYNNAAELSEALDIWLVAGGHTGAKGRLARWMADYAPDLGLQLDSDMSDPGSRPSWMDIGADMTATAADPNAAGQGTASTPALDAMASQGGLPQRVDARSEEEATLVASDPTLALTPSELPFPVEYGGHAGELGPGGVPGVEPEEKTDPEGEALPNAMSAAHRHAFAPSDLDATEKKVPLAALLGGGAALALALVVGVFVFTGSSGDVAIEPGLSGGELGSLVAEPDPKKGDAPGTVLALNGKPQQQDPGVDPKAKPSDAVPSETGQIKDPVGEDPTGKDPQVKDPTKSSDVIAAGFELVVETVPTGVAVEVGKDLFRSPWSGKVAKGKALMVRALFPSGAVTQKVTVKKSGLKVTLYEKVALEIVIDPASAKWSVTGPDLKIQGSGRRQDAARLVPGQTYHIIANASGYDGTKKDIKVRAGSDVKVSLKLRRRRVVSAGKGTLVLFAEPFVKVKVAGRTHDSPVRGLNLKAGSHKVSVSNPNLGIRESFKIVVAKGKETRVKLRWQNQNGKLVRTKRDVGRPQ